MRDEAVGDVRLHLGADGARVRSPGEREMQLDADPAVVAGDLDALVAMSVRRGRARRSTSRAASAA